MIYVTVMNKSEIERQIIIQPALNSISLEMLMNVGEISDV